MNEAPIEIRATTNTRHVRRQEIAIFKARRLAIDQESARFSRRDISPAHYGSPSAPLGSVASLEQVTREAVLTDRVRQLGVRREHVCVLLSRSHLAGAGRCSK